MLKALYIMIAGFVFCSVGSAAINYDASTDTILINDYPHTMPCTLERLYKVDRLFGWGRVTHDPASDTYTVAAQLVIGANDGTDAYFQVGSVDRPREQLIMRNNLFIAPHWIKDVNPGRTWWQDAPRDIVNRLTLGVAGDSEVTPGLVFEGGTLYVGNIPPGKRMESFGGQLFAYHAAISGAQAAPLSYRRVSDGDHMFFQGNGYVIEHTTISGFSGFMTTGITYAPGRVNPHSLADTVFENGGVALLNGGQRANRCVFRNLTVGIMDHGSLNAVVTECVFENNQHNWALTHTRDGLTLIDCVYDEPAEGNIYRVRKHPQTGEMLCPKLTVLRHLVVKVTDGSGTPVAGARVQVRAEGVENVLMADPGTAVTDETGTTPGRGQSGALRLTEYTKTATEIENQPARESFVYTITAEKDGLHGTLTGVVPDKSWKVVEVLLVSDAGI